MVIANTIEALESMNLHLVLKKGKTKYFLYIHFLLCGGGVPPPMINMVKHDKKIAKLVESDQVSFRMFLAVIWMLSLKTIQQFAKLDFEPKFLVFHFFVFYIYVNSLD